MLSTCVLNSVEELCRYILLSNVNFPFAGDWVCAISAGKSAEVWGFLPGLECWAHKIDALGKVLILGYYILSMYVVYLSAFLWVNAHSLTLI